MIYNIKRKYPDWVDDQTLMLMVSPDFSGIVTTIMAQALSTPGKPLMYVDCVHVPDPDEQVHLFQNRFQHDWPSIQRSFEEKPMEKFILVEAGVISGRNYQWITDMMINTFGVPKENILTVALYESTRSVFKCDIVGERYDSFLQDLCFWWEIPNVAFGDYSEEMSV